MTVPAPRHGLPEHGPWSRAETTGAEMAAEWAADARFEADLAAAYDDDPDAFDIDWRCGHCRCLNRWHESFCFRCGDGSPRGA